MKFNFELERACAKGKIIESVRVWASGLANDIVAAILREIAEELKREKGEVGD